uniref:Kinesin family member 18A n=1 Tax=Haplochromis burtoni TaxID=8153 RepID=A0A3Q3CFF6_HAPBU
MASDVCSHVKVVVRVRPANDSEKHENCRNVVQVVDNHMLIFDPKEEDLSCFGSQRVRNRNINKKANKDLKFVFDLVFDENATQVDIFENTTKGVLDGVMNGFNCTVFAYGATGAGKTHTMLGSQNDPGVMYRTMKELFKRMDDAKEEKEFAVAFSYLEVYNEQIRDLLANAGPLAVREDSSKGVVVQGLTLHKISKLPNVKLVKLTRDYAELVMLQHIKTFWIISCSKKAHIPYRDSKLTRILKDSLGGNCRTVMIANVSPSSKSYDDTHNTLKYANRAKEIKSSLKSNVVSLDSHIGQYAVVCEKQRQEIMQLKQKLKEYETKSTGAGAFSTISSQKQEEFKRVSETLRRIFSSRAQIRQEQLDLERQLKENELRQRYSEEDNLQVQYLCAKEKTEKATCKHERKIASLRTQQQHICKRLKEAETRFLENDGWLHRVENEIRLLKSNDQTTEVLEKELHCHRFELQVNDLKQHIKQMVGPEMVNILLPAYSRHYSALRGAGLTTEADETDNQELEHLVLRERGVVWADQEGAGPQQKGGGICVESQETNEAGKIGLRSELAPVLSFTHLQYHQNSPCSFRSHSSSKGNQTDVAQESLPRMPIRRNLSALLPPQSPRTVAASQEFEEDMFPLQCTPEPCQKNTQAQLPGSSSAMDPNMTFEVIDNEDQAASNATIIISSSSPCQASTQQIAPLQEARRTNPTYMSMTSAAQGKRKVVRSASEGYLNLIEPQKPKSIFYKTSQQLKRVAKRM